jgi:hypothetical protein
MKTFLFAVLVLLLPAGAGSEAFDATLEVRLKAPPSGLRIRLRSASSQEWSVDGSLLHVPAGDYELQVELPAGVVKKRVELEAGEILTVSLEGSSLTLRNRRPIAEGALLDPEALRDLPSGRSVSSLLETTEAATTVDRIDGGGLSLAEPGLFGVHGTSWTQTSYHLGDTDITEPTRGGVALLNPDLSALQEVSVLQAAMPVEVGGPGAVVNLVPKRPGEGHRGSLGASLIPSSQGPPRDPPALSRFSSLASGDLAFGGPLVSDRLAFLLSGNLTRSRRFERASTRELPGDARSLVASLLYAPSSRDEARLLGSLQGLTFPFPGRSRFALEGITETDTSGQIQAGWDRRFGGGTLSLAGGYGRLAHGPEGGLPAPDGVVERLLDGPMTALAQSGRGRSERWNGNARLHLAPRSAGALRMGVDFTRAVAVTLPPGPSGLTAELVDGLPARVWDYGYAGPESRWHSTEWAFFLADRIALGRMELEGGLRFESLEAGAFGATHGISWRTLSPRTLGRFRVLEGLVVLAGFARYSHRLPLSTLAFGDPAGPQGLVYRWDDTDKDGVFQPGELGPLVARVGPGGSWSSIDPALVRPHTDEILAGVEASLGKSLRLRLVGIHRRARDLLASVNVGVGPGSYHVSFVPDPGGDFFGQSEEQQLPIYERDPASFGKDRYLLTNPRGDDTFYEGLDLTLAGTFSAFRFLFGGTASRAEGIGANRGFRVDENDPGLIGEVFEDPNAQTNARGRLFFDRAYTLKISAISRLPRDIELGAVVRYQDGEPFARFVIAPNVAQGPEAIQAIPRGRSRFSYTMTVDARIEKTLALPPRRLGFFLEAFNLLNDSREVEEDVVTTPTFRKTTAVQPPRVFRFGLRFDF